MSFLSRAFTGGGEARTITGTTFSKWFSPEIPTPYQDAMMSGTVPEGSAMSLSAFYACVTLLADIISTLSLKAYKYNKDGTKVLVTPQPQLFNNGPFPEITWYEWLWMELEALATTGNCFGYVTARSSEDFRPTAIMPIHPDCVQISLPEGLSGTQWPTPIYHIDGSRIPTDDIIHIKRYPIAGATWGMSPIQKAAASIGLSLAAEKYGLRYFRDSANPSGILTTDQELTPEQSKRAMKQWLISHQGRRLPAVMSGGIKWQAVTITPEESQFLETRKFQRSEIAMWFRIPSHMISDTDKATSWGTGIEEMTLGFLKYTLMPWLTCIEQALSAYLPRGTFAKFNVDDLLRGDFKARWEGYRMGRDSGVYSANEIREMEDMQPIEGPEGDIRLQPANFVPLGTKPSELAGAQNKPSPSPTTKNGEEKEKSEDYSP